MDYTALSLPEVQRGLEAVAVEAQGLFGGLDPGQLNWRPDPARWSVAQCLDHLLTANRLMIRAADDAQAPGASRSVWQRLPVLPGILGGMLIRSQSPGATRRFTAPAQAHPASSDIEADIVRRFVSQHEEAVGRLRTLDESLAARAIMTSPFVKVVTYRVLDGWRLVLAHDRRHLHQAQGVMASPGFPPSRSLV
ncbi:MAG: DinB family protein [Vicinamibacterales bacterium]